MQQFAIAVNYLMAAVIIYSDLIRKKAIGRPTPLDLRKSL
jgi:hypothetical protein